MKSEVGDWYHPRALTKYREYFQKYPCQPEPVIPSDVAFGTYPLVGKSKDALQFSTVSPRPPVTAQRHLLHCPAAVCSAVCEASLEQDSALAPFTEEFPTLPVLHLKRRTWGGFGVFAAVLDDTPVKEPGFESVVPDEGWEIQFLHP